MKVVLFGRDGKVGSVLGPRLVDAGHEVLGIELGEEADLVGYEAAVDFTAPAAVLGNARSALGEGLSTLIGTTGMSDEGMAELDTLARERGLPCLVVPNFAIGAVLMMRFAEEASRHLTAAEVIELHHETKVDAPSGTAAATVARMQGDVPIHSVRLPGLIAHQEVILGSEGQTLTIRHDTSSRDAFVPGVLLALDRLATLPPGLAHGLETVL